VGVCADGASPAAPRHPRRAVPGPPQRPGDRQPDDRAGGRPLPTPAPGQARQAPGRFLTEIPMPRGLLLPTLAGGGGGRGAALLSVALWIRRQRRAADGIVATAQKES